MTKEEIYKASDVLNTILDNYLHGGEAAEVVTKFEDELIKSNLTKEEPVSEGLEKAAEQDVCEVVNTCSATGIPNDHIPSWVQDAMINEFIHGAKWGKNQAKVEIQAQSMILAHGCPKEPVSEDLKEACEQLAENARKHKAATSSPFFSQADYIQGVIDGSNWQMQRMMAKGVDGEIGYWNLRGLSINTDLPRSVSEGDKVKIIVIKED